MNLIVPHVKFAKRNKNSSLSEYQDEVGKGDFHAETVVVDEVIAMDGAEFDDFCENFLVDMDWLKGNGGHCQIESDKAGRGDENGDNGADADMVWARKCLLVVAPGRPSLYVDPQGYNYARYVGI